MICHVYTRVERVVYVVGVTGKRNLLAEALGPSKVKRMTGREQGKPFHSMIAKNVMYIERIGCVAVHRDALPLHTRAARRAEQLNFEHAELDVEP